MPFSQRQIIEQAKFKYSLLRKVFEKQTKTNEEQGRKQINAITNQNERLVALTNKDDHKNSYEEIFEELVKERFDKIKELTDEINNGNLIYYFAGNTARNKIDDFNNGTVLFRKIQSAKMKLEKAKKTAECI